MNNTLIQTRQVTRVNDRIYKRRSEGAHLRSCQAHRSITQLPLRKHGVTKQVDVKLHCTRFHALGLPYTVLVSGTGFETKIQRWLHAFVFDPIAHPTVSPWVCLAAHYKKCVTSA